MSTPVDTANNPIGTEMIFEDEQVRIWRIDLQPGEVAALHTHLLDYTTVVVEGSVVERPNSDGTVDRIELKPGDFMRWHQGTQTHSLRNIGPGRFRNVIIEMKSVPADYTNRRPGA